MLAKKDYLLLTATVAAILAAWLAAVDFGKPPFPIASPISSVIFSAYTIVVVAAGVVASIFIGAMVYFAYKFREVGHGEGESS
ncbi:MAG: respiratory chain protein [Pyrobaculum sp.]